MKKAIDFFTAHPARFFLVAALLWGALMFLISIIRGKFDLDGLLTEANGMVFDLLVFGVLLSIYERLREKRDKIERLHEEIDDYRLWDEEEATYRIVGAIRRLNKLGVSKIDLNNCFLKWGYFSKMNLCEADLYGANLIHAVFFRTNLYNARLQFAQLQRTSFLEADLRGASLQGAVVGKDWFEKLNDWNVKGREEIKAKYFIDEEGRLQEKQ